MYDLNEGEIHGNVAHKVGNNTEGLITNYVSTIGYGGGYHTRLNISVPATMENVNYLTLLTPYHCVDTPKFAESVFGNGLGGLIKKSNLNNFDTLYNLHLVHLGNNADSLSNPFGININQKLKTNAKRLYFSYSSDTVFKTGYCNAYTNFRELRILEGNGVSFNNIEYIKTNKKANVQYKLVGKYKYQGYIETDSIDSVSFYLPDMDSNYAMGAIGKGLTYVYNDTSHIITLIVPAGKTNFLIQIINITMR